MTGYNLHVLFVYLFTIATPYDSRQPHFMLIRQRSECYHQHNRFCILISFHIDSSMNYSIFVVDDTTRRSLYIDTEWVHQTPANWPTTENHITQASFWFDRWPIDDCWLKRTENHRVSQLPIGCFIVYNKAILTYWKCMVFRRHNRVCVYGQPLLHIGAMKSADTSSTCKQP